VERIRNCLEFVHITKTAGSKLESIAAKNGIAWGSCKLENPIWCNGLARTGTREMAKEFESQCRGAAWHNPKNSFKTMYMCDNLFTVVRDPYARMLSEFNCPFAGYKGSQYSLDKTSTLNEWVQRKLRVVQAKGSFKCYHGNRQYEYVYDKNGTQIIQHILYYENLDNGFNMLMQKYNLPFMYTSKKVQRPISRGNWTLTIDDFSNSTIHAINTVYAKDFETFGYPKR